MSPLARLAVGLVTLGALAVPAWGLYSPGDAVVSLTTETFDAAILNSHAPALVEFYSPQCGHCVQMAPEYKKVARNLQGLAVVGAVDCMDAAARGLCATYQIRGFPTVKVFQPDLKTNPYTQEPMKEQSDYTGERSARALSAAITDTLHDKHIARPTTAEQLQELLKQQPPLATLLLFTDKAQSTALSKALSLAFVDRLRVAEVRSPAAPDLVQQYEVTSFPTIMLVEASGQQHAYEDALKAPALRAWLEKYAAPPPPPRVRADDNPDNKQQRAELPGLHPVIKKLTMANLTQINAEEAMWLVGFYSSAGRACEAEVSEATKLLQEVQEVASLGLLDVGDAPATDPGTLRTYVLDVAALKGDGACTVQWVLLPEGDNKQDHQEQFLRFEGAAPDGKALQKWVVDEIPDMTMPLASEEELRAFESLGASADGPDQTLGKVLLISSKQEVPGVYKALAARMRGRARYVFGWVQQGTDVAKKAAKDWKITKVPGLGTLVPPPSPVNPTEQQQQPPPGHMRVSVQPYWGPMKFQHMQGWLLGLAAVARLAEAPVPGMSDGRQVAAITSQQQLQQDCLDKGGVCVLGLLPHPPSSSSSSGGKSAGQGLQQVLQGVAKKFTDHPMHFAVLDASQQPSLRDLFGLQPASLPAVVAVSAKRLRFAVVPPPHDQESLVKQLNRVLDGRAGTSALQALPAYVDGGEQEQQEAAPEEVVEEEFDLSDIMNEEVSGGVLSKEEQLKKIEEELAAEAAAKAKQAKKKSKKRSKKKRSSSSSSSAKKDEL